ncbi:unnamed protein product [Euphydryas editha]|uniref:Uncharacterized protein n=1 Tax=Euphydryas editha TaxID=104508 RepID=A0AAU9V8C9_EUPED|nr:unnamed protein product [Euphydryas editha]
MTRALSESDSQLIRYNVASDLTLPKKLKECNFAEILHLLDNHFTPKRSGVAKKHNFHSATQRSGKTHTQATVRRLATHYGFKNLEEALLDRFVMEMTAGPEHDTI